MTFWLISLHSFYAETQIRTAHSGAQHRPLQLARPPAAILGVPVTAAGPALLLALCSVPLEALPKLLPFHLYSSV